MKILGAIMVVVGGLILGWNGLAAGETVSDRPAAAGWSGPPASVVGGIVVVAGLIVVASGGRRPD